MERQAATTARLQGGLWPPALIFGHFLATLLSCIAISVASGACVHRVAIQSEPAGATVLLDGHDLGPAPVEVVLWSVPFTHPKARLNLPGYRAVQIDLSRDRRPLKRIREFCWFRWKRAFGLVPGTSHDVVLIERHGPSGTWKPEDVPE
jgi:hypothetical protein